MTSKILTVSNLNSATFTDDNAEILSTFDPPLSLNIDTQFNFKSGFIDVVGLGNSGQDVFTIDKDINANISISFYEQALDFDTTAVNNQRHSSITGNPITATTDIEKYANKTYLLYRFTRTNFAKFDYKYGKLTDYVEIAPVVEVVSMTIDAGTYTPDSFVKYLNVKLQGANVNLYGDVLNNHETGNRAYVTYETLVRKYTDIDYNDESQIKQYLAFVPLGNNPISFPAVAPADYLGFYYSQEYQLPGSTEVEKIADMYMGTSLFSLENNEDLLRFSYTHNPLFDAKQQIVEFAFNNNKEQWRIRRGGICLVDLQPRSLWFDILGFSDSILLKPIVTFGVPVFGVAARIILVNTTGPGSVDTSTTRPFIGLAEYDVLNPVTTNTTIYNATNTNYAAATFDITDTVGLNATSAVNFSDFNNGGHFLLSIEIGQNVNNFISNNITQNIISIMSREYLNDGFISVFDGGNPLLLSSNTVISYIRVNIIDPLTNKNALNLGNRNTFYFELG